MARNRELRSLPLGVHYHCAVQLMVKDEVTAFTEPEWFEDLTVEVKEKWAYVYFPDESCKKLSRTTNKSAQVYIGKTVAEALQERRRNNLSREGLTKQTKARIQAEYAANPIPVSEAPKAVTKPTPYDYPFDF